MKVSEKTERKHEQTVGTRKAPAQYAHARQSGSSEHLRHANSGWVCVCVEWDEGGGGGLFLN